MGPIPNDIVPSTQLSVGQVVMVNYNFDSPKERGFWYDGSITKKASSF